MAFYNLTTLAADLLKIILKKLEICQTICIKKKYFAHIFAHSRKFLGWLGLFTLIYSSRSSRWGSWWHWSTFTEKYAQKKAKKPNELMSYSLTKKRPAKKDKKYFFGKKSFLGRCCCWTSSGRTCTWEKRGGWQKEGKFILQSCFLPHTLSALCCWNKTTKTSNNSHNRTAITGVVRLCNATRYNEDDEHGDTCWCFLTFLLSECPCFQFRGCCQIWSIITTPLSSHLMTTWHPDNYLQLPRRVYRDNILPPFSEESLQRCWAIMFGIGPRWWKSAPISPSSSPPPRRSSTCCCGTAPSAARVAAFR